MPRSSTTWRPGQSGNPNGRPKRSATWKQILDNVCDEIDPDGTTKKEAICRVLVKLALEEGKEWAVKQLMDRTEGKAKEYIEMNHVVEANLLEDKEKARLLLLEEEPEDDEELPEIVINKEQEDGA